MARKLIGALVAVGATQELAQIIIPGRYDPCGPVRRESSGVWE